MTNLNLLKFLLIYALTFFYAYNFQTTPDFVNYYNDWIMGSFVDFSDPISRIIFTSFEFIKLPNFSFPFLFLLLLFRFSHCKSFIKFAFIISSYPIIFNSLITPRFFAGLLFFAISLDYFNKDSRKKALFFLLLSFGTHLSMVLFLPIFIILQIFKKNNISLKYLFLLIVCAAALYIQNDYILEIYDLFSYRLDQTGLVEAEKSKPYLHYLTASMISLGLYHFRKSAADLTVFITITFFYVILIGLSFFHYDLIISRLFHGASIFGLFFMIRIINFNSFVGVFYAIYFSFGGFILFLDSNLFNNSYGVWLQSSMALFLVTFIILQILFPKKLSL